MEIWNINGQLDEAVNRFKDLTVWEVCDKVAEFASIRDDSSFVDAKLALADRLNSMSENEIDKIKDYAKTKISENFPEYDSIVMAVEIKRMDNLIDRITNEK